MCAARLDRAAVRDQIVGLDVRVPLLDGATTRPINFDNAASTPALRAVADTVTRFLDWYSSVHRGAGFKSQLATQVYEEARHIVGRFVGADPAQHAVLFGKNSTEALNKLARRIPFKPGQIVLCSELEHHSNDLPWRQVARVVTIRVDAQGRLDAEHYAYLLRRYAGQVRLVAVSGGSNVTGAIPPVHALATQAHAVDAEIVVDCAQLAPHRPIAIGDLADPAHLDYVVLSGHKLYAPFGSGALIGRKDSFAQGVPEMVGGGTVQVVTDTEVIWAAAPAREEAGTPNVVGAVALAAAVTALQELGMAHIAAHEAELTAYALRRLAEVPGLRLYGESDPEQAHTRLGVVPLALAGVAHGLTAAVLSCEYGIAVRNGTFCAQPYLRRLLGIDATEGGCTETPATGGAARSLPGLVRVSFGLYNTTDEIDSLVEALQVIARGAYRGQYSHDPRCGAYRPEGWAPALSDYFTLERRAG